MMPYVLHHPRRVRYRRGFGDTAQDTQLVQAGAAIGAPVAGALAASSAAASAAAGGTGLILGMAPALAVPIIGAAIAGVAILATVLIKNSGCGQTCIETSSWANQAEPILAQNIQAYFSNPAPRTQAQQAAALQTFDSIWARLVQMCSDPSTGNAGKRCISDRQAGACTWKQTSSSPLLQYPGQPQPGACWNWFSGYRDGIASDQVVPDSAGSALSSAAGSVGSALSSAAGSLNISPLLLIIGLGAVVWAVAS